MLVAINFYNWLLLASPLLCSLLATAALAECREKRHWHWMALAIGTIFLFAGQFTFAIHQIIAIPQEMGPGGPKGIIIPGPLMWIVTTFGRLGYVSLLVGAVGWNLERWRAPEEQDKEPLVTSQIHISSADDTDLRQ